VMHQLSNTLLDNAYLTLHLLPLTSGGVEPPVPWELEAARFGLPLLTAGGRHGDQGLAHFLPAAGRPVAPALLAAARGHLRLEPQGLPPGG